MAQEISKINSWSETIAAHREPPTYYERPNTKMNSQLGDEAPAYVLQWRGQQEVSKEYVNSAKDLRMRIEDEDKDERRLFVIRGLPLDYLEVLRKLLGIDPYFIEAHVRRRNYRPLGRRKDRVVFAYYDYPELVGSYLKMVDGDDGKKNLGATTGSDVVDETPVHVISHMGDRVVFCRASLWLGPRANILFLDRLLHRNRNSSLQKVPQHGGLSKILQLENPLSTRTGSDGDTPSLETLLCEGLSDNCESGLDPWYLLEDIAIRQWFDLFEALPMNLLVDSPKTVAMYWQIQNSLERNLGNHKPPHLSSARRPKASYMDWEALLARMGRRTQLLSRLYPVVAHIQTPLQQQTGEVARRGTDLDKPDSNSQGNDFFDSEENKRALDRVAYMGGVLLPFSIVSGILSMGDRFGPGGSMFFVYWATAIPLTLITLLVIYADSIRKAQVWMEVAAAQHETAEDKSASDDDSHSRPPLPMTPGRLEQGFPDGVNYSYPYPYPYPFSYPDADTLAERARIMKLFSDTKEKQWQRGELGWLGACMTALKLYKLKTGAPPPHRVRDARRTMTA